MNPDDPEKLEFTLRETLTGFNHWHHLDDVQVPHGHHLLLVIDLDSGDDTGYQAAVVTAPYVSDVGLKESTREILRGEENPVGAFTAMARAILNSQKFKDRHMLNLLINLGGLIKFMTKEDGRLSQAEHTDEWVLQVIALPEDGGKLHLVDGWPCLSRDESRLFLAAPVGGIK
jgi:hypothetical protein